jgi:DNA-binding LacI/PurR family transcriptional regulator/ABC-type glycerol-3-phosphate transport system substrate-binding protein
MVGIKDIAKLAGVSKSTVSNVLNNKAAVSVEKIKKVQEAILSLNYKANETARSLKTKKTTNIGVILPNITDTNYSMIFIGIERVLTDKGYTASLYTTSEIPAKENIILEKIQQQRVDGIIIITCQPGNIFIFDQLEKSGMKLVFLERKIKDRDYNFLEFDNYESMLKITEKHLSNGAKKIYLITGPIEYSSELQCVDAYKNAHQSKGVQIDNKYIIETNFNKESAFKISMRFLNEKESPDAIITTSVELLKGVLEAIYISKSSFTNDIDLISLSEYSWISRDYPFITKIPKKSIKMGADAAEILINNIDSPLLFEKVYSKLDNLNPLTTAYPLKKMSGLYSDKSDNNLLTENIVPEFNSNKVKKSESLKALMLNNSSCDAVKILLPIFEKKENIKVDINALNFNDLYKTTYDTDENKNFDIFQIDIPWLEELVESNCLLKLDDFIVNNPDSTKGFIPGVLDIHSKYNSSYYALPYMFGTQILFYRKDLFENLFLKSQFYKLYKSNLEPPKTWKEFNIIARFFTRKYNSNSPVQYGATLGAQFPAGAFCEFLSRMWSYCEDSNEKQNNLYLNEICSAKALENYVESFQYASKSAIDNFWEQEAEEFSQGKAAMMILFVAHASDISDRGKSKIVGNVGYDIVPGRKPVLGGWSLGINNRSNKKEEAFRFINWITSKEMAIPFTILGGFTPRVTLFKSSELLNLYPWLPKAYESFSISKRRMVSKVSTKGVITERDYERIYGDAIIKAIRKESSSAEAIKDANQKIKNILMERS